MMEKIPARTLHIYALTSFLLFITVEIVQNYGVNLPEVLSNYLNDFLTLPMVSTLCLHAVWWVKKNRSIRLDMVSISSLVVMYSLYFEYYLPKYTSRYTGDIWDVICYASGGIVFYVLQKSP